ncbi:serine/threonine protein kinase [Jannaschia sp. CCS1]|nr:serine/threonine protein kinase [Jannaschia sp. CCS1]
MSDDPDKTRILPDAPAGELPVGAELSQGMYRITGRIAAGGFGITYEARDNLDRKVAIKECFPAGLALRAGDFTVSAASASTAEPFETARTLFLREARMLAALRHPNIVHVQTLFEENGTAYMAMDYVDGRDLQQVIADEPGLLTPAYIMELTRALLAAMDYLHRDAPARGIGRGKERLLHRDIKPANIRIDPFDAPVVIDFGAARQETKAQSRAAGTFRVVSDGYSPGEFYVAGADQGPASDLYSLAATLYHCISGAAPAPADARAQKVSNGEADPYEPIAGRFPPHDPRLLALIDRALARPLKDRPSDAAAWLAAIPDTTSQIPTRIITPVADDGPAPAVANGGVWKGAAIAGVSALALMGVGIYALSGPAITDETLQSDLAEARATVDEMEAELAQLAGIAEALQGDIDAAIDARDQADRRADDLAETVQDLRAQLRAASADDDAETQALRAQLTEAQAGQTSAETAAETLTRQVAELEAQIAALGSGDTGAMEAERTAALAAQEVAERAASRAQADLQRMAADLDVAEAEAARLSMELRTTRAEIDLMTAGTTLPNPGPAQPPAAAACPTWTSPGEERRFTGTEIYNAPQTLSTRVAGTTDLGACDGLPEGVVGVVTAAPTYTLYLSEMAQFERVEMRVSSVCDTTLLVNTQDTVWHFDNDGDGGILPLLNLSGQQAIEGRLDVWIGTADGTTCTADLELSTWLN